jgi:hypothetical protein
MKGEILNFAVSKIKIPMTRSKVVSSDMLNKRLIINARNPIDDEHLSGF